MLHSLPGRVVTRDGVASLLYQATRSLQKKKKKKKTRRLSLAASSGCNKRE
jgi:hypothetical protein